MVVREGKLVKRSSIVRESVASEPKQSSLFGDCSWENYCTWTRSQGKVGNKEWADFQQFKKSR